MPTKPIYVLAGQSNANNRQLIATIEAEARAAGGVLVHHAVNGSSLSPYLDVHGNGDWSPGSRPFEGELLATLSGKIGAAMRDGPSHLAGVIWIQGEADGRDSRAAEGYATRLLALHDEITARFGAHRMVISQLSGEVTSLRGDRAKIVASWAEVREAQAEVAAARETVSLLDPDALAGLRGLETAEMFRGDQRHYNAAFGDDLGTALMARLRVPDAVEIELGTPGADRFVDHGGRDRAIWGGEGTDTLVFTQREAAPILRFGDDGAAFRTRAGESRLELNSVERLIANSADDRIYMGGDLEEVISAAGDDLVVGSARGERISLRAGDDRALGHGGDDRIVGGPGQDSLYGNQGADTLFGGAGGDFLGGGLGGDHLMGDGGDDTLYGWHSDDRLSGGAGDDLIRGGPGADRLSGDAGDDTLHGGAGADLFVFSRGDDLVQDFDPDEDRLRFPDGARLVAEQQGRDTVIDWDGGSVVLEDVALTALPDLWA
ncbi:sialate O-acetylesterase [Paracoccus sp. SCSIO 75233]|uniref:sialate O-acetylesterase n=1 Tax=Paracoccus sp. SCSIO 75233 TaxID=3017782 RepID=UPI0022F0D061|nr:sialate O-acetylesterase [Paracoccus sp. SCSIO 75233]WBU54270.1 hypothetical protein PAF12_05405 [Paracoccus sp. SCSIO 75233]